MNVLLVCFAFAPGQGSEPGISWNWARSLSALGHQVTVVTASDWSVDRADCALLPEGMSVVQLARRAPRVHLGAMDFYRTYRVWLRDAHEYVAKHAPGHDVAHHVTLASPYWGSSLEAFPRTRILGPVGISGQTPPWAQRELGAGRTLDRLRNLALTTPTPFTRSRDGIRGSDWVLASDDLTSASALREGIGSSPMLADAVATSEIAPHSATKLERGPLLVWAGRMLDRKAAWLAVKSFGEARRHLPEHARLVMLGDGPGLGRAVEVARDAGIGNYVEFHWICGACLHWSMD